MPTTLKRVPTPLDEFHAASLTGLHSDPARLAAAHELLGQDFTVPTSESGAAGALLTAVLDRIAARAEEHRLAAFYRDVMFPNAADDVDDAEGLATDRALAAAASEYHGHDDDLYDPADFAA